MDQGAVRVEIINKERANITDFIPLKIMREKPEDLDMVFPKPVADKIKQEKL